jgi:hypothetical protein
MKNGRRPQKINKMEDDLNFKADLLRLFNNKNLKNIDLVNNYIQFYKA